MTKLIFAVLYWMIGDRVITSYRFYKMTAIAWQIYFRFLVWPPLAFKLLAYQIFTRYLNLWSKHYYFGILLPVLTLTFSLSLACDFALIYQILCKLDDSRAFKMSYRFYRISAIASIIYSRSLVWSSLTFKKNRKL